MKATTAILFFSRTANAEANDKRLFREKERNQRAWTGLIARARRTVSSSGLPVFWVTEGEQQGATFGEKLYHAALLEPRLAAELPVEQIKSLVDDMIDAHGAWLPALK